jgi:tetratricopeptide (TPR) repeat protein
MLRVEASEEWETATSELARDVSSGANHTLWAPFCRRRVMASVLRQIPDVLYVHVPPGLDQLERVLLTLGDALGSSAAGSVDDGLRRRPDDLEPLLDGLERAIARRPLVVDGWDRLGHGTVERELNVALAPRVTSVRNWLKRCARLLVVDTSTKSARGVRTLPAEPAVRLANGGPASTQKLLDVFGDEPSAYALALAARALGDDEDEVAGLGAAELGPRVYELLPSPAARLVRWLAVHGRELSRAHLPRETQPRTLQLGLDLGLWMELPAGLALDDEWASRVREELPREVREEIHGELARRFLEDFRPGDETAGKAGLSVLEAHRHFVAAGDIEQARACWRYGGTLLIEAARQRSIAKDYKQAASLYAAVLGATERDELPMPTQLRSYARHYLHFNRAHGGMEDLAATERGYRKALEDWPGNALFWSRLIRVSCYRHDLGAALVALREAAAKVPAHSEKNTILIARTVRGLLDRRASLVDAVRIWGDYEPETALAEDVADRLRQALETGWSAKRLVLDADAPLVFVRPVELRVSRAGRRWVAELRALAITADAGSPETALRALVKRVRDETAELVRAYSPDLSPSVRFRKRTLLGMVDLVASRLGGERLDAYWVFGRLDRADGKLWLRAGGGQDVWFEVPDALATDLVVDDHLHLAKVATDEDGTPKGPVLVIEKGFQGSDDELWDAWRRLMSDAG